MRISRVRIDPEGFLGGMELQLVDGLNVIIGARGTGKTSLVEVIRYCTGANAFTEASLIRGTTQAQAILGGALASVSVEEAGSVSQYERGGDGNSTPELLQNSPITVLSQNEIEDVGARASGRLYLIDRFRDDRESDLRALISMRAKVRSLTEAIQVIIRDGLELSEQLEPRKALEAEFSQARSAQLELLASAKATEQERLALSRIQVAERELATRESLAEEAEASLQLFESRLQALVGEASALLRPWPAEAGADVLADSRLRMVEVQDSLYSASKSMREARERAANAVTVVAEERDDVRRRSRALRQRLDEVQVGVGEATRRMSGLEDRMGQMNALLDMRSALRRRYITASEERNDAYSELDRLRGSIFAKRKRIADELNRVLAPRIKLDVTRSTEVSNYRSMLLSAFRGSGLKYTALAGRISVSVSPLELITWIEEGQVHELARALDIAPDRAAAIIGSLRTSGAAEVVGAEVEDGVTLRLLDGPEYKPSQQLSIGQRCTAVLPVLLSLHGRPLIIDQPEDNLDNAFIASTLIPALRRREPGDQLIFTSHNANIPVLGEADRVIVLDSDGQRAWVAEEGRLDDPNIVRAISDLMEGGERAFQTRAEFYRDNG